MFSKLKQKALGAVLARALKKAAEGGYGPRVQAIYWKVAGSKFLVFAGLEFLAVAIEGAQQLLQKAIDLGLCAHFNLDCPGWLAATTQGADGVQVALVWAGVVFLHLSHVDAGVRMEPPAAPISR